MAKLKAKRIMLSIAAIALVAVMAVAFVACNADSYQGNLEKNGYTVTSYEDDKVAAAAAEIDTLKDVKDKIEWMVVGNKVDKATETEEEVEHSIIIVKFDSTDTAKKFVEDNTPKEGETSEFVLDRQTNTVFIASDEAAIKAAK